MTPADLELYEERAAVRQYCGGLPRDEAERLAREDVRRMVERRRAKNQNREDHGYGLR